MNDLLIINGIAYIDGCWKKTNIAIKDEKIVYIGLELCEAEKVFDASGLKIIPGIIDPHVHFSLDCGTIISQDSFSNGTIGALFGGVTTIIDFVDPARNAKTLEKNFYERLSLAKESYIDYHLHGCIKEPDGDLEEYVLKMKSLGINSIKLFTTYSETKRRTYDKDIYKLLLLSKKYDFIVECHAENDELIINDESYRCYNISEARPSECETTEVLKLAQFAKETNGNLYIVHCSSGNTVQKLIELYPNNINKNIYIESCPQYFIFNNDFLKKDDGYLYTFAPPLRSRLEQELLVDNISHIYCIGTDHCPFNKIDKQTHTMLKGHPLGIGGIEYSFLVMHSKFGDQIIDKMTKNVAKVNHFEKKGSISIGKDADLTFIKDVKPYTLGLPHGEADYSVYEGMSVNEKIVHTMLRGRFVLKDECFISSIKGELINCD